MAVLRVLRRAVERGSCSRAAQQHGGRYACKCKCAHTDTCVAKCVHQSAHIHTQNSNNGLIRESEAPRACPHLAGEEGVEAVAAFSCEFACVCLHLFHMCAHTTSATAARYYDRERGVTARQGAWPEGAGISLAHVHMGMVPSHVLTC